MIISRSLRRVFSWHPVWPVTSCVIGFCAMDGGCLSAIIACVLHLGREQPRAQAEKNLSVEIVAPRDDSGNTYLPHGEAFEVRFTNLSEQPVRIWDCLCEPGQWAVSVRIQGTNGESQTVVKREVPATVWNNYPPKAIAIAPGKPYVRKVN